MADTYLTTANVAVFNEVNMPFMVDDVLNDAPFLRVLAARTTPGIDFKFTKQTAAPTVGFRAVNDGVENFIATRSQVTVDLKYLDGSFAVDVAAAKADDRGTDHLMAMEALSHLRQAMFEVEEQIIKGTVGNQSSNAFNGFADQSNLNQIADAQVVNAAGTTAATGSSVYLVRMGEGDVEVVWGEGGVITISERRMVERTGATGRFWALAHEIGGWVGLKIGSTYSVVRIANLTEDSGKGLTDLLISNALSKFPASRGPDLMVMNRRSLQQLQKSRTATNPTGAPAPFPDSAFNVPIVVTDAISSTETLLA